jgi:pimeloyl-ACP methyl ester carboxylesterase
MKITMRDGARLNVHTIGRGPTVVLLHGFAMPGFLWLPFVTPLAHQYRFVLPDLRGFGGSHRLPLAQASILDQHASDLADVLRYLGESEVLLGGLSMGACTSLQYQRRYGFGGVRAYLHMDQSACVRNDAGWQNGLLGPLQAAKLGDWAALMADMEPWRGQRFDAMPAALRSRLWATLVEFFGHAFARRRWQLFTGLAKHERLIRQVAPVSNWPVYMDTLRSYLNDDYDWRPSLPQLKVPMTAMVAMQSTMYPAAGQLRFPEWVPQVELVRFERCGHAIPFEAPRKFVYELSRFLGIHRPVRPRVSRLDRLAA